MIKGIFIILFILLIIPSVFAQKITKVEMNPFDDCRDCTEWAELYSEEEIDLEDYYFENKKGTILNLSGIGKGEIKVEFKKRFLTNTGDKLILKKGGAIIDETPLLKDEKNNEELWIFCNDEWFFGEECLTENTAKNITEETLAPEENLSLDDSSNIEEENEEEQKENTIEKPDSKDKSSNLHSPSEVGIEKKLEVIKLNAQTIKSQDDTESSDKKTYAMYSFVLFCLLIGVLFVLRKNKFKKNEFTG